MKKYTLKKELFRQDESPGPPSTGFRIDYRKELNTAQYDAVTSVNGPHLIIAGAGTGKTRTVTYRVAYLVELGVKPESILLLTFTRRAAQEMLRRAAILLVSRCEKVAGGTFHSFANMVLRQYAPLVKFESTFTILDQGDAEDVVNLPRTQMKFDTRERRFPRKQTLYDMFSRSVNTHQTLRFKNSLVEYFPILNLLDPGRFHGQAWFIRNFVETFWKGNTLKYGGLAKWAAPRFKELVSSLVIRHERSEVMKDLPPILESQRFYDLSDPAKYRKAEADFQEAYDQWESEGWNQKNRMLLGQSLMQLKHLAGQQKIPYAIDAIRTFLEENPSNGENGRKLTVFVHNHDVHDAIVAAIKELSEEEEFLGVLNPALEIRGGEKTSRDSE